MAHARWATGASVTAIDVCAAALARAYGYSGKHQALAKCVLVSLALHLGADPASGTPTVQQLRELLDGQPGLDLVWRVVISALRDVLGS